MFRVFLVAAALTVATAANADDAQLFGLMPNEKTAVCSGYSERSPVEQAVAAAWVAGFVAGVDTLEPAGRADSTGSRSAVRTWLASWCTEYPGATLGTAAKEYRRELMMAGHP